MSFEIVLVFLAGWLTTISGVALGGFLVYRTKRDPYDPLFTGPSSHGDSFNIDDGLETSDFSTEKTPKATEGANNAFVNQFAEALSKR